MIEKKDHNLHLSELDCNILYHHMDDMATSGEDEAGGGGGGTQRRIRWGGSSETFKS